jgi:hypothetical protein
MSESLPAQARKVVSWFLGCDIHALKKFISPSWAARARASLYTGSNLDSHVSSRLDGCEGGGRPLMVLNKADHVIRLGELDELVVVLQRLHGRLGEEDVHLAHDRILGDVVVRVCAGRSMDASKPV